MTRSPPTATATSPPATSTSTPAPPPSTRATPSTAPAPTSTNKPDPKASPPTPAPTRRAEGLSRSLDSCREGDPEGVAGVDTRVDSDRTAQALHQPGADREPEADAAHAPLARKAVERLEDVRGLLGGDRLSAARHREPPAIRAPLSGDIDPAVGARAVLERVGH